MELASAREKIGSIATPILAEHTANADAKLIKPVDSSGQKIGRVAVGLVRVYGWGRDPQAVVHGDTQQLCANSLDVVATVPVTRCDVLWIVGVEDGGGASTEEPGTVEIVDAPETLAEKFKLRTELDEMFREAEDGVIIVLGVDSVVP